MNEKKEIIKAIENLQKGNIICFETDTIVALACDATNENSVNKIYKLKKRDKKKPFSIFTANINDAKKYADFSYKTEVIAKKFWPGALTIILPSKKNNILAKNINSESKNIAIRIPSNEFTLEILKIFNKPLVATSTNYSGQKPATTIEEAKLYFKSSISYTEDIKVNSTKNASTIIQIINNEISIIRKGDISFTAIMKASEQTNSS